METPSPGGNVFPVVQSNREVARHNATAARWREAKVVDSTHHEQSLFVDDRQIRRLNRQAGVRGLHQQAGLAYFGDGFAVQEVRGTPRLQHRRVDHLQQSWRRVLDGVLPDLAQFWVEVFRRRGEVASRLRFLGVELPLAGVAANDFQLRWYGRSASHLDPRVRQLNGAEEFPAQLRVGTKRPEHGRGDERGTLFACAPAR